MNVYKDYSLKHFNTFNLDVKTKYYYEVFDENELKDIIKVIQGANNFLILGSGSNILFTKDFDGIVIKYKRNDIEILHESENDVLISADANVIWDDLVNCAVNKNYYGLENLSLIPGTVGAAPVQNIGAYGVEVSNVIEFVEGYKISSGEKKILYKEDCAFAYRDSIFKNEFKNNFIITRVAFRLSKEKKINVSYRDLQNYFKDVNINLITASDIREAVIKIRKSKLPDLGLFGNAGSFFKNPEVSMATLELIRKDFADLPFHKINDKYKIPAAWLIEKCGFKGKRIGNVGTYEKQALVIINYGNATGEEIKNFADEIKKAVYNKFNINLEYEVMII